MRTGVFVQVRLGSTRLPHKSTLPLAGATVIQHVMRSIAPLCAESRALLTDEASLEVLRPLADAEGYEVFPGPAEDVLARYCMACRAFRVDRVIRVTGDNPLTSAWLAREILSLHERRGAQVSHYLGNPWGTGVEAIEAAALFEAERHAAAPGEREHITTFMYRNRDRFLIIEPQAPAAAFMPEARVTIDTAEDYARVKSLFADLYKGQPIEVAQVVGWFAAAQRARGSAAAPPDARNG
jgi:spore coat polysaccharide biosynthesis protein SpsF